MFLAQYFFIFLYILSIFFFGSILKICVYLSDFSSIFFHEDYRQEFDYIIVGGGSAGSIIAQQLSQDSKDTVLLLEAGKNTIDFLHIPSFGLLLQGTPFDWSYRTVSQQNSCLGLIQNKSIWPMGKVLGGTSMLNNMLYVRGHKQDFDLWFIDKKDYRYSDILMYFKELENFQQEMKYGKPVFISNLTFTTWLPSVILKAARSLGFNIIDENLNSNLGFNMPKANLYKGSRWTAATNLRNTKNSNLFIKTSSFVEKVLLKSNFEAKGVKYNFLGKKRYSFARKAVILSAGVIGTPKILMLSGFGPKHHLETLNIPVAKDLPVGNNLQDHITTGFDLVLLSKALNLGLNNMLSPFSALEYFVNGTGPWTTTGCEAMGFSHIQNTLNELHRPDLQFMVMPLGIGEDKGYYLRKLFGISDSLWSDYFSKIQNKTITILPILLHPKSVGTVRLQTKDPFDQPLIDPQYLSHKEDVNVLIKGIEIIKALVETKEFRSIGAKFNKEIFPGCENHPFDSKEYWECYIRHLTITSYHPIGTCKMGNNDDHSTVVNFNFQVKGTNKLYIADGSVLPSLPTGNPNAAIMLIAKMAADTIKKQQYLSLKRCRAVDIFTLNINKIQSS
ncbi:hypothetical protein ABEB36_005229 [Hypothenemus hampei]|uniref:Glucose-methanol-choline oxidoreductase N-terminal domain-containing protein n=1 Tax=Hypothenemus hampei TaxID=57062 RepID=A0ABD1EXH1_HYPHA